MKYSNEEKINFIMSLGKAMHRYGASADRIESALVEISKLMNMKGNFLSTPTSLLASFRSKKSNEDFGRISRLPLGSINLHKLALVDQMIDKVIASKMNLNAGVKKLDELEGKPPLYHTFWVIIANFLISASVAAFLGGNLFDIIISGILGSFLTLFYGLNKRQRMDSILDTVISFSFAFIAQIPLLWMQNFHPHIIILASVIYLIPGLMLTTAISELATHNLMAGSSRLIGAMIVLLKISFGIYLSLQIGPHFFGNITESINLHVLTLEEHLFWGMMTALGLSLAFQADKRDIPYILGAALLIYISNFFISNQLGNLEGAFIAATLIGSLSHLFSRIKKRPAHIILLPSIILLVPGSLGHKGIQLLILNDVSQGIQTLFHTSFIAMALVTGFYFGSLLIKPKRVL